MSNDNQIRPQQTQSHSEQQANPVQKAGTGLADEGSGTSSGVSGGDGGAGVTRRSSLVWIGSVAAILAGASYLGNELTRSSVPRMQVSVITEAAEIEREIAETRRLRSPREADQLRHQLQRNEIQLLRFRILQTDDGNRQKFRITTDVQHSVQYELGPSHQTFVLRSSRGPAQFEFEAVDARPGTAMRGEWHAGGRVTHYDMRKGDRRSIPLK